MSERDPNESRHLREPVIHSHITDVLPEDHLLAHRGVDCEQCGVLVHAANNECMQTWVETGRGNYCLPCFSRLALVTFPDGDVFNVLDDDWGLCL